MCFNLNLPNEFMSRVRAVYNLCPPSVLFDEELAHRFGEFDSDKFFERAGSAVRGHVLYGFEWRTQRKKAINRLTDLRLVPFLWLFKFFVLFFPSCFITHCFELMFTVI